MLVVLFAVAGLTPLSTISHADDDSGSGPDENVDRGIPGATPPVGGGAEATAAEPSDQITVLRVGAAIDDFRYDPLKLTGTAREVCAGAIGNGTLRAFYEVVNRFGGTAGTMYACRERWDVANNPDCNGTVVNPATNPNFSSTCWSNHAQGRAFDVMVGRVGSGYNNARGVAIVNWLLAPDSQNSTNSNARKLGVQQVLFNNRCWNSEGDRGITTWATMRTCSVGHQDHIHVDMTVAGTAANTSYWGATPVVAPKPDTQVLWDQDSYWREAVSWWNLGAQSEEGLALPAGFNRAITGDWDSDGRQDEILLWNTTTGAWFLQNWTNGDALNARMGSFSTVYDEIVAGDWDGDGKVDDMFVWDVDTGNWVILSWSGFEFTYRWRGTWSRVYDKVVAGDFDGDGRLDDMYIWDQDGGVWVIQSWSNFRPTYRKTGRVSTVYDELLVGDWSAGGDLDETIIWDRDTGLWVLQSWSNFTPRYVRTGYWSPTIKVGAPGDYDTDGRMDDLFLYDPVSGRWAIHSYHRNVPRSRLSGTWLSGFDVINVGSFSD